MTLSYIFTARSFFFLLLRTRATPKLIQTRSKASLVLPQKSYLRLKYLIRTEMTRGHLVSCLRSLNGRCSWLKDERVEKPPRTILPLAFRYCTARGAIRRGKTQTLILLFFDNYLSFFEYKAVRKPPKEEKPAKCYKI